MDTRQLVPNDSHDWDVTHATPMFSAMVDGAMHKLVATAGKDGMLRALDRETHRVLYETPTTTRENAETPVITTPLHACPGVLGSSQWNGPAFNAGTNLLYVPAVDWCSTFSSFEQVRYIPGKLYMGQERSRPARESAGLAHRRRRVDRRGEMEVQVNASDGGGGHDDGRQSGAHRRADR
jgi:glucose dehydrogenase